MTGAIGDRLVSAPEDNSNVQFHHQNKVLDGNETVMDDFTNYLSQDTVVLTSRGCLEENQTFNS